MKTVGVTDYTNQTPPKHFGWKKCLSSTPVKNEKISNVHKMGGAHLQCINNYYGKFEYKGMKTWSYRLHKLGTPKVLQTDRWTEWNH